MRGIGLAAVLMILPAAEAAAQGALYQCDTPTGKRVDYGDVLRLGGGHVQKFSDGPQWSDDGFNGVRPVVQLDGNTMRITWGDAVPPSLTGKVPQGTRVYEVQIQGRDLQSVWGVTARSTTVDIWRFYTNYRTLQLVTSSVALSLQDPITAPSMAAIFISNCRAM